MPQNKIPSSGKSGDPSDWTSLWAGSEERPDDLDVDVAAGWIAPSAEPSKEYLYCQQNRLVYADVASKRSLTVETTDFDDLKRIVMPIRSYPTAHLPGKETLRFRPEEFGAEAASPNDHAGHRPPWMPATPAPTFAPWQWPPEPMRRISGRPVDPLYVFGPDDRRVWVGTSWPWGLVGRIFNSDGKSGTGALIGPRLVATAGHLVPWGKPGWWMKFVPAYYNGQSAHGPGFESYVSDARGWDTDGDVTGYDCAVLRLYEPLGSSLGYFGYNSFSNGWIGDRRWTILGYPGAVANAQMASYQTAVSVFDVDSDSNGGRELETKADLTPGNSGGPMFGRFNGDPRLIGVVSGQETDWTPGPWPWDWGDTERGNVIAGGGAFTGLMAWGRTNWP